MPRLVVPRGGYEEVKDSSALLVDAAAPRKVFVDAAAPPRRAFCAACALLLAAALGGLVGYAAADGSLAALVKARCGARSTAPAAAPPASTRHWIFAELSAAEVRAAARAAQAALPGRVLTSMAEWDASADYITGASAVELIAPPKAAARAWLDGASDAPPPRYAKVTVARGSVTPPDVMEYRVGPLRGCDAGDCGAARVDGGGGESVVPLTAPGEIAWAKRPVDLGERALDPLVAASLAALAPELRARFGDVFEYPPEARCGDDALCPAHDAAAGSIVGPVVSLSLRILLRGSA